MSRGLAGWAVFAEGGSCDRLGIALWPCRWAALTKCDQDDVLDVLANSMFLLRLMACVAMAFLYCVAGAILWKCVNASSSFSRGRRTLCADAFSWQAQHFVAQCRWFLMDRSVRTAQT